MNIKKAMLFLINATILTACGSVTPVPFPQTPTAKAVFQVNTPYSTITPTPTLIPWVSSTPETFSGYPTAQVPIEKDPFGGNVPFEQVGVVSNELYVGKYVIRNWCKPLGFMDYCVITISSLNEKQLDISELPSYVSPETGTDLAGTGNPDIVIVSEIGNAAGEQAVRVFEAGDTLKEILFTGGRGDWKFEDLNKDNSFEFIGDARVWSKFNDCQILNFPFVYEYAPNVGYVIKTYKYQEVLLPGTNYWLNQIALYKGENPGKEIPLCNVYGLVATYLVSGETKKAWAVLDENYSPEKAAEYKEGMLLDLKGFLP